MKSFRKSEVAKCVDSPPFFNCYFSRNRVKMQSVQKSAIDKQFSWKRDDVTRGEERQDGKFMIIMIIDHQIPKTAEKQR